MRNSRITALALTALALSLSLAVVPSRAEEKPAPKAAAPDPTKATLPDLNSEHAQTVDRLIHLGRAKQMPEALVAAALLLHKLEIDLPPAAEGQAPTTPQSLLKEARALAGADKKVLERIAEAQDQLGEKQRALLTPLTWKAGLVTDATSKQRVAYLTDFNGLGLGAPLAQDLTVSVPFSKTAYPPLAIKGNNAKVVGIITQVSWAGGLTDALSFSVYVSPPNAKMLNAARQSTLQSTKVDTLGFWIGNYDQETKAWYGEFYPKSPQYLSGQLNRVSASGIRLGVANSPVNIGPGRNIPVYQVYFEIIPAAGQPGTTVPGRQLWNLESATSATNSVARTWGYAPKSP
jgi:hypothetical protein